jgi:hypothetical protein
MSAFYTHILLQPSNNQVILNHITVQGAVVEPAAPGLDLICRGQASRIMIFKLLKNMQIQRLNTRIFYAINPS